MAKFTLGWRTLVLRKEDGTFRSVRVDGFDGDVTELAEALFETTTLEEYSKFLKDRGFSFRTVEDYILNSQDVETFTKSAQEKAAKTKKTS